jgi:hypothetical protein
MKDPNELMEQFITHGKRAEQVAKKFANFTVEIRVLLAIHEQAYRVAGRDDQADILKSLSARAESLSEEVREVFMDAHDDISEVIAGYREMIESME